MMMTTRRQESTEPRVSTIVDVGAALEREAAVPAESKPTKPLTPMAAAVRAQAAIDRINKRETDAMANMKARYRAERDEIHAGLSDAVKRILEAAAAEPEIEA